MDTACRLHGSGDRTLIGGAAALQRIGGWIVRRRQRDGGDRTVPQSDGEQFSGSGQRHDGGIRPGRLRDCADKAVVLHGSPVPDQTPGRRVHGDADVTDSCQHRFLKARQRLQRRPGDLLLGAAGRVNQHGMLVLLVEGVTLECGTKATSRMRDSWLRCPT